jgi:ribosomal protein L7/L12
MMAPPNRIVRPSRRTLVQEPNGPVQTAQRVVRCGVLSLAVGALIGVVIFVAFSVMTRSRVVVEPILPPSGTVPPPGALRASAAAPDERVIALVRAGKKIEAIKQVRERTGAPLKDAKEAVEAVQRKVLPHPVVAVREARPKIPHEQLDEALLPLVREGRKIEAIKLHREQTGLGLRESKEYVEALQKRA